MFVGNVAGQSLFKRRIGEEVIQVCNYRTILLSVLFKHHLKTFFGNAILWYSDVELKCCHNIISKNTVCKVHSYCVYCQVLPKQSSILSEHSATYSSYYLYYKARGGQRLSIWDTELRFQSRYSLSLFFLLNNMNDCCVLKIFFIFIDLLIPSFVLRVLEAFEFLVTLK